MTLRIRWRKGEVSHPRRRIRLTRGNGRGSGESLERVASGSRVEGAAQARRSVRGGRGWAGPRGAPAAVEAPAGLGWVGLATEVRRGFDCGKSCPPKGPAPATPATLPHHRDCTLLPL